MEHFFALMIGMLVLGFIGGFVWIMRNKTDMFLAIMASALFLIIAYSIGAAILGLP